MKWRYQHSEWLKMKMETGLQILMVITEEEIGIEIQKERN